MNKGVAVLGMIIAAGIWFFISRDQKMSDTNVTMEPKKGASVETTGNTMMPAADNATMAKGGQYVSYDTSKIDFAKEGKVVLFFRASWCPSCRALDADIKAKLSQIPQNILILDVNYDTYKDLKKQYGVTYQHTLVQVDAFGNMIAKWNGSPELGDLLKQIK